MYGSVTTKPVWWLLTFIMTVSYIAGVSSTSSTTFTFNALEEENKKQEDNSFLRPLAPVFSLGTANSFFSAPSRSVPCIKDSMRQSIKNISIAYVPYTPEFGFDEEEYQKKKEANKEQTVFVENKIRTLLSYVSVGSSDILLQVFNAPSFTILEVTH